MRPQSRVSMTTYQGVAAFRPPRWDCASTTSHCTQVRSWASRQGLMKIQGMKLRPASMSAVTSSRLFREAGFRRRRVVAMGLFDFPGDAAQVAGAVVDDQVGSVFVDGNESEVSGGALAGGQGLGLEWVVHFGDHVCQSGRVAFEHPELFWVDGVVVFGS